MAACESGEQPIVRNNCERICSFALLLSSPILLQKGYIYRQTDGQTIGEIGYELTLPTSVNVHFSERDTLWIRHSPHGEGRLRFVYQVGEVARNVCWNTEPGSESNCQYDYDFPLLAIEAGSYINSKLVV